MVCRKRGRGKERVGIFCEALVKENPMLYPELIHFCKAKKLWQIAKSGIYEYININPGKKGVEGWYHILCFLKVIDSRYLGNR